MSYSEQEIEGMYRDLVDQALPHPLRFIGQHSSEITTAAILGGAIMSPAAAGAEEVIIDPGDTLSEIAQEEGTTVAAMQEANPHIVDPDVIFAGDTLEVPVVVIPTPEPETHIVSAGDTLSEIAAKNGLETEALAVANQLPDPDLIYVGDELVLAEPIAQVPDPAEQAADPQPGHVAEPDPAPVIEPEPEGEPVEPEELVNPVTVEEVVVVEEATPVEVVERDEEDLPDHLRPPDPDTRPPSDEEMAELDVETPNTEAGRLAKQIVDLEGNGIEFPPATQSNDRVRRSVQDIIDDGRTFIIDVHNDNINEVEVNPLLLRLVLDAHAEGHHIFITSLTTSNLHSPTSKHYTGGGIDLRANPDLFRFIYERAHIYGIDELIWGGSLPEGTSNIDRGSDAVFSSSTLEAHSTHIHIALDPMYVVTEPEPEPTPAPIEVEPAPAEETSTIVVGEGDTLSEIGEVIEVISEGEVTSEEVVADLIETNDLDNPDLLEVGQELESSIISDDITTRLNDFADFIEVTAGMDDVLHQTITTTTSEDFNVDAVTFGAITDEVRFGLTIYLDLGMSPQGAACMMGTFIQESTMNPNAFNASENAHGFNQWRLGREDGMPRDPEAQLLWALQEMDTRDGNPDLRPVLFDPNASFEEVYQEMRDWTRYGEEGDRFVHCQQIFNQLTGA